MTTSPEIAEVVKALAKARIEFKPIAKARTATVKMKAGGQYSYQYADLSDILDAVVPALSANGLAVVQPTYMVDGVLYVRTVLMHSSGQFLASEYPVCSIVNDHKEMGAAMTYGRRYAYTSLLGIQADEDTGEHASATVERGGSAKDGTGDTLDRMVAAVQKCLDGKDIDELVSSRKFKAGLKLLNPDQYAYLQEVTKAHREHVAKPKLDESGRGGDGQMFDEDHNTYDDHADTPFDMEGGS